MTQKLYPFQEIGSDWLAGHERRHLLLADECGLGKSAQTIAGADMVGAERILVVCPAIARINWIREFEKFSDYRRPFTLLKTADDHPVKGVSAVCSFRYASNYLERLKQAGPFDLLVVDETHLANSTTADCTRALFGERGLVHEATRTWALTGTPIGNNWGDLWVLLYTFGLTTLSYDGFLINYCETKMGPRGLQVIRGKTEKVFELRALLDLFMLRRKKMDVLKDLPPIRFEDFLVEPGSVDFDTDTSLVQYVFPVDRKAEFFEKLEKERFLVDSLIDTTGLGKDGVDVLTGLSDSVSTLRRYNGLLKVDAVAKLVAEELDAKLYPKVVIFAIHQGVIEGLRAKLARFKAVTLYGGTPPEKRQINIDKFQKNPRCQVIICNIKAAGTNITLTAADQMIFVEQEWNPIHNAQAAMRCHRIGQKNSVLVRCAALANSIDQRVSNVLKRKTRDELAILG